MKTTLYTPAKDFVAVETAIALHTLNTVNKVNLKPMHPMNLIEDEYNLKRNVP